MSWRAGHRKRDPVEFRRLRRDEADLSRGGYVLVPVVLGLSLIALVALLLSGGTATNSSETGRRVEAARARTLAESGLEHAVWRASHGACSGDFSLASTGFEGGSYTASASGGASSTSYVLSADRDAWIRSDDVTRNNGTTATNHIRLETGNSEQILVRFDLSSVPANARVQTAIAWLHLKALKTHPEGAISVHPIEADWGETTVTWESFGGRYGASVLGTIPAQDTGDVWVAVNLTAQVQAWVNGQPNYGILLETQTDGIHAEYTAREDSTNPPRLGVIAGTGDASPLDLVSTGTLASGLSRSVARDATPAMQPAQSVTLRPGPDEGEDAYVWAKFKTTNYETDDETWVATGFTNAANALFEFDVTAIPRNARILDASLSLHHRSGNDSDVPITAHRITRGWQEDSVTWNERRSGRDWDEPGGDFDPTSVSMTPVGPASGIRYAWDLTPLVQGWVDGTYENRGVILRTEEPGTLGERFDTSDHSDPTRRPSLTIRYACECGRVCMGPRGSGNILLVIGGSPSNPSNYDDDLSDMLESWGYSVTLIQDDDSAGNFSAAAAAADVVVVSESVSSANVGTKLSSVSAGVVTGEGNLNDELGLSTGSGGLIGDAIDVVDNSHPITAVFAPAPLQVKVAAAAMNSTSGALASGARVLAETGGAGTLVALARGGVMAGGGTAPGRRVLVPAGEATSSLDDLTSEGRLVIQRAIEWSKPFVCNDGDYRDSFGSVAFDNDDGSLSWSGSWVEVDGNGVGPASGNVWITSGELRLDDAPDTGGQPSVERSFNLNGVTSAELSFDYALGWGTEAVEDVAVLEVSTDGVAWTELQDFSSYDGGATGSLVFDLSPYRSSATRIRFRIATNYGGPDEYLAIDDVAVTICGAIDSGTLPLAHWKLDETAGTTAVDSVGGHDGTLNNGPVWAAGHLDGALDFDGVNDAVRVTHDDLLSLTSAMTFTAWINSSSFGTSYQTIVAKDGGAGSSNYWFGTWRQELVFGFFAGGFFREVATSGLDLQTATWYHLAASFDDATDAVVLYVDGVPIQKDALAFSPTAVTADLSIGRSPDGELWRGLLDDVRIYDTVILEPEIVGLAAEGSGGGGDPIDPGSCEGTVSDDFESGGYAGSTGTIAWTGPWTEINESDGAGGGDEQVVAQGTGNSAARIQDNDGGGEGLLRETNVAGRLKGELSFRYWRVGFDDASDYVKLEISSDGGANWSPLAAFEGPGNDAVDSPLSFSANISAHLSSEMQIRFVSSSTLGRNESLKIDDVAIVVGACAD